MGRAKCINGYSMAERRERTLVLAKDPALFSEVRKEIFERTSIFGNFENQVKNAGYDPWMWEAIAAVLISAGLIEKRAI